MTTTRQTVASVVAGGVGSRASVAKANGRCGAIGRAMLLAALAGSVFGTQRVLAQQNMITGPVDPRVVVGNAAFARQGNNLTITTSRLAIINYSSFNVGANEYVRFVQPDASSRVMNRITGAEPTRIEGRIDANGRVYWINPAGVTFGQGAVVNVGQFFAAAGTMTDRDFVAGLDRVAGTGRIENNGTITAGSVTLAGRSVSNYGTITGLENSVVLAAGDEIVVTQRANAAGGRDVSVRVASSGQASGQPGVQNSGQVAARRRVAFASGDVASMAIQQRAGASVTAPNVTIDAPRGNVMVAGSVNADNATGQGGTIAITGDRIALMGADVSADGATGGGQINVGGNQQGRPGPLASSQTVYVDGQSTLSADATTQGDGGRVIVWSDRATNFQGDASATGAGTNGAGGFIETSSRGLLNVGNVSINTSASLGGRNGTWLLDPSDITIVNNPGDPAVVSPFDPVGASASISDSAILGGLATGDVIISTAGGTGGAGTIIIDPNVNIAYTGAADRTLTFDADSLILMSSTASITSNNGRLNLFFDAGGSVFINGTVATNGGSFRVDPAAAGFTLSNGATLSTARTGGEGGLISLRPSGPVVIDGALSTNGDLDATELLSASTQLPIIQISGTSLSVGATGSIVAASGSLGGNIIVRTSGAISLAGPVSTTTIGPFGSFIRLESTTGTVTQSGLGVITGGALSAIASGNIDLDLSNVLRLNSDTVEGIGLFAARSDTGSITFRNSGGMATNPLTGGSFVASFGGAQTTGNAFGVLADNGNVTLNTPGGYQVAEGGGNGAPVRANTTSGVITLNLGGSGLVLEQQSDAAFIGSSLVINVTGQGGAIILNRSNNDVGRLEINASGATNANMFARVRNDTDIALGNISLPVGTHTTGADVDTNFFVLRSNGAVTQELGSAITARGVGVLGVGTFELNNAGNSVRVVAGNGPSVELQSSAIAGLEVGRIDTTTNASFGTRTDLFGLIVSAGDAQLVSSGPMVITRALSATTSRLRMTGGLTQSGSGTITGNLGIINDDDASATTGEINLNLTTNDIGTLAIDQRDVLGSNRAVTVVESGSITIGSIAGSGVWSAGPVSGITNTGGNLAGTGDQVFIQAIGQVTVLNPIEAANGRVRLEAGANAITSGAGRVNASELLLLGTGTFDIGGSQLVGEGSAVQTLAADVNGRVILRQALANFSVGTIGTTVGVNVGTGANNTVTIIGDAGSDTLSQTAPITAGGLLLRNITTTNLNSPNNAVGILAAEAPDATATLSFVNDGNLEIGTVNDGVTTAFSGLVVGGTPDGAVNNQGQVRLNIANGGLTQTATGNIIVDGLEIVSSNAVNLTTSATNAFDLLSANITGAGEALRIRNTLATTIGTAAAVIGLTTNGGDATIISAGAVNIAEAINLGATGGTLRIDTGSSLIQSSTGTITANALGAVAAGTIGLDQANDVNTVAMDNSVGNNPITFRGNSGYTIGTVGNDATAGTLFNGNNPVIGIRAERGTDAVGNGATVTLLGDAGISQSADAAGVGTGNIIADSLVIDAGGPVALGTSQFNNVDAIEGVLTVAGAGFAYADRTNLQVGGIGATTGISTNNGAISLTTGVPGANPGDPAISVGRLTLNEALAAGTGTVTITSTDGATQNVGATIVGDALLVTGTGAFDLDNVINDVNTLAAATTGATSGLTFADSDGFAVGTVGTTNGINVGSATGNTVVLSSTTGTVSQTQPIVASGLALRGSNPSFVLTNTANSFGTLVINGSTGGDFTVRNSNATTQIGSVGAIDASTYTQINTTAGAGSVTLMTAGTVSQVGAVAGDIVTDRLALIGNGTFNLTNINNDVNRIAAGPSNAADLPAPDRFTSGPAGLTFVNSNAFAVDTVDPFDASVGPINGISATGPVDIRTQNADAITLRQNVATSSGGVILSDNVLLDAPGPGRLVTIDGGSGIVRVYGTINGAAGTADQQNLVVRSAAPASVDVPPIGFGGSIGATTALRTVDLGQNLGAVPSSSTVVFASNWITAAGPNQNRVAQNPGSGPFTINARDSFRTGDLQKLLSFGNLTINSRGANGTVNAADAGADRGVARFGDVSVVGAFVVNADDIQIGLRPIQGAGAPGRPFGRNFTDAPTNNPANRQQLAENGTGEDGIFHPPSDTNGADIVTNSTTFGVQPSFILGGTQVTRAQARAAGVQTISIFSVSDPVNTSVPGFNGNFDIRRRQGPRATLTVANHFFPSSGALPTSTPSLDLIATGDLGALETRNPVLPPNLPEVDRSIRLTRVNREFLGRLQVPLSGVEDPSAAIDRLVGRSLFNDAVGAVLAPAPSEEAFFSTLRDRHSISVGRVDQNTTNAMRQAYENLFVNPQAPARNVLAEAYSRFQNNGGGSIEQFGAFVEAGEPEANGVLRDLRTFFGQAGSIGLSPSEGSVPMTNLLNEARPEAISLPDFRTLIGVSASARMSGGGGGAGGGGRVEAPTMTPVQARRAVASIEQSFNETFLVQVPIVGAVEGATPGTYPRYNAIRDTLSSALAAFAAANEGSGDATAFTRFVEANNAEAAGYLREVRGFFSQLDGLGMSPTALEDSRQKTLNMLRPSNISPELFRQLILG
jgi:filamentous hemagglutinin family protein